MKEQQIFGKEHLFWTWVQVTHDLKHYYSMKKRHQDPPK